MVSYSTFSQAFHLARGCETESEYIQACTDAGLEAKEDILKEIFAIEKLDLRERRERILHISRAEMHRRYQIPLRTLEDWEAGKYKPADYVEALIAYTMFSINLKKIKRKEPQKR